MLSRLGIPLRDLNGPPRPITRPPINLPPLDDETIAAEAREIQTRIRLIRAGCDAWQAIGKAESFEAWKAIGKALQIGRDYSLKATGANRPAGQVYCRCFSAWLAKHEFTGIQKSVRSSALDLVEHLAEIEAWRATLSEKRRRQLKHPLSNVAAWRKATQQAADPLRDDPVKAAEAAWHRFTALAKALPADQAAPLWATAQAQASEALCR
jgi:hypothetical protein